MGTEPRTISGRAILMFLVLLLVIGLFFTWYNEREQDRNVDSYVEQIDG